MPGHTVTEGEQMDGRTEPMAPDSDRNAENGAYGVPTDVHIHVLRNTVARQAAQIADQEAVILAMQTELAMSTQVVHVDENGTPVDPSMPVGVEVTD